MKKEQIIELLKAWEQFKSANTLESEAIDVEVYLMNQFAEMHNDLRGILSGFHDLQKVSQTLEKAGVWQLVEKVNEEIFKEFSDRQNNDPTNP